MKRMLTGLSAGVLSATLVGVSLAWLLSALERAPDPPLAAPTTRAFRQLIESRLESEQQRLQALCSYDVRVERLGLELASLGSAANDVSRVARTLERSHGARFWLLLEAPAPNAREGLSLLGASGKPPARTPSVQALARAQRGPVAFDHGESSLLFACKRALGQRALWVVRSVPPGLLLGLAQELSVERPPTGPDRPSAPPALARVPGVDGARDVVIRQARSPAPAPDPWPLMLGLVMGAGLLGGAAGLLFARKHADSEVVLAELERAADRVAEGDLTSTIDLRVGGKADQTFRSFDRMTRELRETRARLAEAERAGAFQEIARHIAHEIKNPLSPIQLAMETLRKAHHKRAPGFDEIFEESTRAVLEEVRRLERIVREFSEFARLPKPKPGALNLAALTDEVVQLYRADDVALRVEQAGPLPDVRVDREQITQVIVNLLQNAFDAARSEPLRSPRVRIGLRAEADQVVLEIDDSGAGVPEADRARIFEPYVTTKAHGTGLGLAIVKRILSDHGASIEVGQGRLGGARFTLWFPLSAGS